jgi:hypothetical protein
MVEGSSGVVGVRVPGAKLEERTYRPTSPRTLEPLALTSTGLKNYLNNNQPLAREQEKKDDEKGEVSNYGWRMRQWRAPTLYKFLRRRRDK